MVLVLAADIMDGSTYNGSVPDRLDSKKVLADKNEKKLSVCCGEAEGYLSYQVVVGYF